MIIKLFSQRQMESELSGSQDVFQYDVASPKLRVQIQQILVDAIGPEFEIDPYSFGSYEHNPAAWKEIQSILLREFGKHWLADKYVTACQDVLQFIGTCTTEEFIDTLEVCCIYISKVITRFDEYGRGQRGIRQKPSEAVEEINHRLFQANLGFSYGEGVICRADSEFTHQELVKPALRFISRKGYEVAREQFLEAHKSYRNGDFEQAIVSAGKAFESTLKAVCTKKKWPYDASARASDLLKVAKRNELWPAYLDRSFDQLVSTLSSGLPEVRNNSGAHGRGPNDNSVPGYVTSFALNLCASKIAFVVEAAEYK